MHKRFRDGCTRCPSWGTETHQLRPDQVVPDFILVLKVGGALIRVEGETFDPKAVSGDQVVIVVEEDGFSAAVANLEDAPVTAEVVGVSLEVGTDGGGDGAQVLPVDGDFLPVIRREAQAHQNQRYEGKHNGRPEQGLASHIWKFSLFRLSKRNQVQFIFLPATISWETKSNPDQDLAALCVLIDHYMLYSFLLSFRPRIV